MVKQANLIAAVVVALLIQGVDLLDVKPQLDCSGVKLGPTKDHKDLCDASKYDSEIEFMAEIEKRQLQIPDVLEMCTCRLIRRTIVWKIFMTHDREIMYLAIRKVVENYISERKLQADNITATMAEFGESDGRMLFTYYLKLMLRETRGSNQAMSYIEQLNSNFRDIYYDPINMTKGIESTLVTIKMQQSCDDLFDKFSNYSDWLGLAEKLSQNDNFAYQAASYNNDLFKLWIDMGFCQYIHQAGMMSLRRYW